jgi:tetratricopeptide (TPR) repeat protein
MGSVFPSLLPPRLGFRSAGDGAFRAVLTGLSVCFAVGLVGTDARAEADEGVGFQGSASCRACHERFYKLWGSSHHGLAMQPYTLEFAKKNLTDHGRAIQIGGRSYQAHSGADGGWVEESGAGDGARLEIDHVLGGKNVYYFLTPLERGRLQTLPLAYDVRTKEWFDMAASGVRHSPEHPAGAVPWTDPLYTFNTSCYGCHVSQMATNYDLESDTYRTTWREPGIGCETCHGPADDHIRVCQAAPEGEAPSDLKIIGGPGDFTPEQRNATCASCHAKAAPIAHAFQPGDRYFDFFSLATFEDPDYYPDGRDLGENYTYTAWRMSPCAQQGDLDCIHCHTSSGRYRFADREKANEACLPCHQERVLNAAAHTRHEPDGEGSVCVACHMPTTEFARMRRSDHSMRPPTPATTIAYESPNACNICHDDQTAEWADGLVREWRERDYQAPVLVRAALVAAARRGDWTRLNEMLEQITMLGRDEAFANSLVRLLRPCEDESKWPALLKVLATDPSPLLRSSAAASLGDRLTPEAVATLAKAAGDDYRLVRIRAAVALAPVPVQYIPESHRKSVAQATQEFREAALARPDDHMSHYNLGSFFGARREYAHALAAYETSSRLRADSIPPLVNASIAHSALGQSKEAEGKLRQALRVSPNSVAANLNLGMLLGEQNRLPEAEQFFRAALETDPASATAAYNLGVLLANSGRPKEGVGWLRNACASQPRNAKYGYSLAFYLHQTGETGEAIAALQALVDVGAADAAAFVLLGGIYESQGEGQGARAIYRLAAKSPNLSEQERAHFSAMAEGTQSGEKRN